MPGGGSPRVDAVAKVTGQASFGVDWSFPDTAYAAVVRSTEVHAVVELVETAAARNAPGCIAVVTAADLDGLFDHFGHIVPDHAVLAADRVRYAGEPVAVVVAEDPLLAVDLAGSVEVRYRPLPTVSDCPSALAAGAPLLHGQIAAAGSITTGAGDAVRRDGNVAHEVNLQWGDVAGALTNAHLVVEDHVYHPMLYAYAMEPYNASARFVGDRLEVVSATQHPFMVARDLARIFRLPFSKVRVQVPYIGGSYGSKSYTKIEPLACVAAWCSRRPVKLVLDVEQSVLTGRSLDADIVVRTGLTPDGVIVARDFEITMNAGAYLDNTALELEKTVNRCFGPYRIPHLRVRGRAVYTNTVPAASYRGFGAFQGNLAGETNLDRAAGRLGLDPFEIRRRNVVRRSESLLPGARAMDADLPANLALLQAAMASDAPPPRPGWLRGQGIGMSASDAGALPTSTAQVRLLSDGSAVVATGSTEMGQGSRTVLTVIAARELGIDPALIEVVQGDTGATPFERTTGASRTTVLTGLAVQRACADVLAKSRDVLADLWGDAAALSVVRSGGLAHPQLGWVSYAEVIGRWFGPGGGELTGIGIVRREGATRELPPFWEIGMVGVTVDVEPMTGAIEIPLVVTLADVGCAIAPDLLRGQDLGAVTQGVGAALTEELLLEGGYVVNPDLVNYIVPRVTTRPRTVRHLLVERGDGVGPYGSKGAGEGARNPICGAIVSAVAAATGSWASRTPLSAERVWRLMSAAGGVPSAQPGTVDRGTAGD